MSDLASQMLLFAEVARLGSLSAVARLRDQSHSAVSKQIAALEDRLGVRLLTRGQSGVALTAEGRAFQRRCADVARRIEDAEAEIRALSGRPVGVLRVAATVAFGKAQLIPALPDFMALAPNVEIALELTDRPIDFAQSDFDVAVRFTEQVDDDSVIVRKLAPNQRVIVAAPSYLARAGTPRTPADLAGHNCLRLSVVARWNDWRLTDEDGAPVPITGNFEATSADAVHRAALVGVGVARLSSYLVSDDIAAGRLVRLLPDYAQTDSHIVVLFPDRRNLAPKVRVFVDFLVERFGGTPPWERRVSAEAAG